MSECSRFHLTAMSHNHKTGPMPVSTSMMQTCPDSCPFRGRGCYSNYGPLLVHWKRYSECTSDVREDYLSFLEDVRKLPAGQTWRHNQAGDLLSKDGEYIDPVAAFELARVNDGKDGFTYTHYGVVEQKGTRPEAAAHNREIIESLNHMGLTTNISCNSLVHADRVIATGIKAPVTVLVPEKVMKDNIKSFKTPAGNRVVVCPNVTRGLQCKDCNLCMKPDRSAIIAFPAHGSGKKRAEEVMKEWESGDYEPVDHERKGSYKVRHTYHAGIDGVDTSKKEDKKRVSKKDKRISKLESALERAICELSAYGRRNTAKKLNEILASKGESK